MINLFYKTIKGELQIYLIQDRILSDTDKDILAVFAVVIVIAIIF